MANKHTPLSPAFTTFADGNKLPLYLIVPCKNPPNSYRNDNYLSYIILAYNFHKNYSKLLLIFDEAMYHLTTQVCNFFEKTTIYLAITLPHITDIL